MLSDEGQAKIAVCLFNAFMNYKSAEEGTNRIANPVINLKGWNVAPKAEETKKEAPKPEPEPVAEKQQPAPQPEPVPEPQQVAAPDTVVAEVVAPVAVPTEKPTPAVELPAVQQPQESAPKEEAKPAPKPQQEATPAPKPQPETKPAQQQPKQESKPATKTQSNAGVIYRVQFCTAQRQMKAGDPDLQGVRDIHVVQNGKYYVYSAGDYSSVQEARQRCKKIKETTSFRDAFVIAIYRGERITLERAAQIEKNKK